MISPDISKTHTHTHTPLEKLIGVKSLRRGKEVPKNLQGKGWARLESGEVSHWASVTFVP